MKPFFTIISLLIAENIIAQSISDVTAIQEGNKAIVSYNLDAPSLNSYYVKLYYSTNNGTTFSNELIKVKGDAGYNVKPGKQKQITWQAEKEVSFINGPVIFKVEAEVKESMPEPIQTQHGVMAILEAKQKGSNVIIDFVFLSETEKEVEEFAISDAPKITTLTGVQRKPTSGKFGIKELHYSRQTAYNVECVKGVPTRGRLVFPHVAGQSVIPALVIPVYKSKTLNYVFKNIPVE
jgi:hypothetical protein